MSIQVHRPAPMVHHPAALAAAIAVLVAGGAAAGIAWEASQPPSPAPAQHQPMPHRMVHGFVVTPHR